MKTAILVFYCVIHTTVALTQHPLSLETVTKKDAQVILPSFTNLTTLMFGNYLSFEDAMQTYHYTPSSEKTCFELRSAKGLTCCTILKSNALVQMEWKKNEGYTQQLRRELEQKTGSKSTEKEQGFSIYYSEYMSNKMAIKVKIAIKENPDNSAIVKLIVL